MRLTRLNMSDNAASKTEGLEKSEQQEQVILKEGDMVLVDYTIRVRETGELVETTIEEEARRKGLQSGDRFEPKLIIIGRGFALRAFEEQLVGMAPQEEKKFEIPPEKAFGPRDPSKIRVIPLRKLRDYEGPLTVGSRIVVNGREGIIRSIGSGRVQVDFNPYLASKTLECYVKVVKVLTEEEERVKALIRHRMPDVDLEKIGIEIDEFTITLKLSEDVAQMPTMQIIKRTLARDFMDYIDGIRTVRFIEEYSKEVTQ